MGRLVTGCIVARTDPLACFCSDWLIDIGTLCYERVRNYSCGERRRRRRSRMRREQERRGKRQVGKRKEKKGGKEGRRKNCGRRSRTEARGLDRCRGKSSSTELLLTGGRTLTGAAAWRACLCRRSSLRLADRFTRPVITRPDKIILILRIPRKKGNLVSNLLYAMKS